MCTKHVVDHIISLYILYNSLSGLISRQKHHEYYIIYIETAVARILDDTVRAERRSNFCFKFGAALLKSTGTCTKTGIESRIWAFAFELEWPIMSPIHSSHAQGKASVERQAQALGHRCRFFQNSFERRKKRRFFSEVDLQSILDPNKLLLRLDTWLRYIYRC